ncbi:Methyltransferase type 11 [Magnetococcus marinus MC-1]|uniref:Arsenite methyltransferase n=1 Tax=Magnetococcus marinus (strain ATCC BAA-1437 / JCM 17883 / MC-1) TaxID=156889 RepID=A0L7I6_MAGMM|nr:methyltransferase domain-containing protein [Magnetococcus marinus]ABK43929.1 Methyltransferase type 11 [Magnetococcus marinus MC-1]
MNMTSHVQARYAAGAQAVEPQLCCPIPYDQNLLTLLPQEIIERDYGCGDPSRYVRQGETVLDLGSGGGKICYMAAQLVGPGGRVIGVDMTDDMLALARHFQPYMAEKLGEDRVRFVKGQIQDLALDLDKVAAYLAEHPIGDLESLQRFEAWQQQQRAEQPMIASNSVDLVVSNCVLNLVDDGQKQQLMAEIFRVLKPGGRAAISDIVSDAPIPPSMKADAELWSGCISGAFEESAFGDAFRAVGFVGVTYDKWDEKPWRVEGGIEFRSVTVLAYKPPVVDPSDQGHGVIYKGPFTHATDEWENIYPCGQRIAVNKQTYELLGQAPYAAHFVRLAPQHALLPTPFTLPPGTARPVEFMRGGTTHLGGEAGGSCKPGGGCC